MAKKRASDRSVQGLMVHKDIVMTAVDKILPYKSNPKDHPEDQIVLLSNLMRRFGWVGNPIVVDEEGTIVAGHGRYLAALRIKLEEVPVVTITGLTPNEIRALRIADNKVAESAWINKTLLEELQEILKDADDKTEELYAMTGFDSFDLDLLNLEVGRELEQIETEAGATNPEKEWNNMPSFNQQDREAFRTLYVHFASQEDVDAFAKLVNQTITDKTRYIWFPQIVIERYADKRYKGEDDA